MADFDAHPDGRPAHAHDKHDPKDQRSINNRAAAEKRETESTGDKEAEMSKKNPKLPAQIHGNEPSKGAKVDAELQAEEEEELKKKGKA
ncbi:hypothetical protein MKZ38_001169 [Zalerion maritima]|uniref:Uncharacterized protein n=1 Tax=Zalerion maritima TaxID=339359 RepID=A0AAD5WVK7_9PEZI|nr:hypothetical protein MKZ38_001169 [Zalerion maritima]